MSLGGPMDMSIILGGKPWCCNHRFSPLIRRLGFQYVAEHEPSSPRSFDPHSWVAGFPINYCITGETHGRSTIITQMPPSALCPSISASYPLLVKSIEVGYWSNAHLAWAANSSSSSYYPLSISNTDIKNWPTLSHHSITTTSVSTAKSIRLST